MACPTCIGGKRMLCLQDSRTQAVKSRPIASNGRSPGVHACFRSCVESLSEDDLLSQYSFTKKTRKTSGGDSAPSDPSEVSAPHLDGGAAHKTDTHTPPRTRNKFAVLLQRKNEENGAVVVPGTRSRYRVLRAPLKRGSLICGSLLRAFCPGCLSYFPVAVTEVPDKGKVCQVTVRRVCRKGSGAGGSQLATWHLGQEEGHSDCPALCLLCVQFRTVAHEMLPPTVSVSLHLPQPSSQDSHRHVQRLLSQVTLVHMIRHTSVQTRMHCCSRPHRQFRIRPWRIRVQEDCSPFGHAVWSELCSCSFSFHFPWFLLLWYFEKLIDQSILS